MIKTILKNLGLLCIFSFIFMYAGSFIAFFTNFLVFMEYPDRVCLSYAISCLLYLIAFYLYGQSNGYILTSKLRFDKKEQILGTIIGVLIYSLIAFVLIFCPKGIQRLPLNFYGIGVIQLYVFDHLFGSVTVSAKSAYTLVFAETPLFIGIRLLGLFVGRYMRISETPALDELNDRVVAERKEEKKSWKDSIINKE